MQKNIYIIDGSSYIFRAFYAIPPLTNSKGIYTNAIFGVYKMINETKQPLADNNSQRRTFELKANSFIANVNNIANEYVHYVETKSNELLNSYLNF